MTRERPPESRDNLKFCPLIQRRCIGSDCAWWLEIWGVDQDGKPTLDKDCSIAWLPILGREQLIETARTAASHDKVANETRLLTTVIDSGLQDQKAIEFGGG